MLGLPQETPSRLLRRIKDAEVEFDEMPSLPSPPGSVSNSIAHSDLSRMSSGPRRQRRAMSAHDDDSSVVVDQVGSSSINKQQHHRTPTANTRRPAAARSILSPLSGNTLNNVLNSPDSLASLASDSPKTNIATAPASQAKLITVTAARASFPAQATRQAPSSLSTTSPVGSSASTVRHVGHLPSVVAVRRPGRAARTREIVYSDASSDEISRASHSQLSEEPPQPEASASLLMSRSSSQLELQDLADNLDQLDDDSRGSNAGYSREDSSLTHVGTVSDRPASRVAPRFAPASNTAEESEHTTDAPPDQDSPAPVPPLPSPGLTGHSTTSVSPTETDLDQPGTAERHVAQHVILRRRGHILLGSSDGRPKLVSAGSVGTGAAIPSPGVGRRLPPSAEGKYTPIRAGLSLRAVNAYANATPATVTSQATTSVAITFNSPSEHSGATPSASASSLATLRPQYGDTDLERRKSHLLSALRLTSLRSTTKPRLKKGTPHPLRQTSRADRQLTTPPGSALRRDIDSSRLHASSYAQAAASASPNSSGEGSELEEEDVTTSSVSSHNLTTHPRGIGNTTLPLAGTGLDTTAAVTRFNGTKLNNYLHTLNTHLSQENQNLVRTLEQTAQEVQRLLRKNRELSSADGLPANTADLTTVEQSIVGDATSHLLEQHQKTSDDIAAVRQHLVGSARDPSTQTPLAANLQMELNLARLQLEQREEEVQDLRQQLIRAAEDGDSNTTTESDSRQQHYQKIFELTDELVALKHDLSEQDQQLAEAKNANLEAANRHTAVIADMNARTDGLLAELQERDTSLEELEERIGHLQESHVESMKSLEEELTNVLAEHEEKMRLTEERSELLEKDLKAARLDVAAAAIERTKLQEQVAILSVNQTSSDPEDRSNALMASLTRLREDATLHESAKQQMAAAHAHALADLQNHCTELEDNIEALEDDVAAERQTHGKTSDKLAEIQADVERVTRELHDAQQRLAVCENERRMLIDAVNSRGNGVDTDLQGKLDAANRQIGNLRHQLASPSRWLDEGKNATLESKDLQIRTLESTNHQLKSRVAQLKRQEIIFTPAKSLSEKSVRFDSINSLQTPRGVTQMLADLSNADGSAAEANQTARPLYNRIDTLQDQIRQLRVMLRSANEDVDDKLHKLGSSGQQTMKLAKQLEAAQRQNRQLEAELQNVSCRDNDTQVLALKRDLEKIKRDAGDLAEDLQVVISKQRPAAPDFGGDACAKSTCIRLRSELQIAKDGSRGLLVQIRYLKAKFTRESWFKADLSHQKLYLQKLLQHSEIKLAATNTTLERFGMPAPAALSKPRPSMRKAAHAVLFAIRARRLASRWKLEQARREQVKDAFLANRGRAV